MRNRKKAIVFRYVPGETAYTPEQLEGLKAKEDQLIRYIIEKLLFEQAPRK